MKTYSPKNKEKIGVWDDQALLYYQDLKIHFKYETEPPHGDFIYSVQLSIENNQMIIVPFWIYGRSIRFFYDYVLLEAVEIGSYKNLRSMLINVSTNQYAILDDWYNRSSIEDDLLILSSTFHDTKQVIEKETELNWFPLFL